MYKSACAPPPSAGPSAGGTAARSTGGGDGDPPWSGDWGRSPPSLPPWLSESDSCPAIPAAARWPWPFRPVTRGMR